VILLTASPLQCVRAGWSGERDRRYHLIMEHGWNPERGAFTQHDKTDVLDAALLMLPLVGFVVPSDPMWLSTLDAMDGELVSDSLGTATTPAPPPTGCAGTRAPSRSAPSGTWTRWPARAGWSSALTLDQQLDHGPGRDAVQ
jgi:GH15 family glucan-1,4-alpha-glucosidase